MDNIEQLNAWRGRAMGGTDLLAEAPLSGLAATLERDDLSGIDGTPVPPLWHWLYFLPRDRQSEIGDDGHPRRGGFLPPVPLPRRMWAGGRLVFLAPLVLGARVTRISTLTDVSAKNGRSGPLVFVTVRHDISCGAGLALVEEQDIVYRAAASVVATPAAPMARTDQQFSRTVTADRVMLFRYSALTFNSHRIHYDRDYARAVEGYPGLVVHGPLIATLLADLLARRLPQAQLASFTFKAVSPLFDTAPFQVCGRVEDDGKTIFLWACNAQGHLAMDAVAVLA